MTPTLEAADPAPAGGPGAGEAGTTGTEPEEISGPEDGWATGPLALIGLVASAFVLLFLAFSVLP